ncbi:hypothetical protein ABIA32_005406 [Streptacidiphilus sp. MAP12-20]|uniref:TrmB family transcriptional regulator n=1 Tax=Streptacidiphilus sp. MAP12-20 TaxID=3156299 RepID=UPI0035161F31
MTPTAPSSCELALETLGLTPYASRAYAALARVGQATATDLADTTRVPRQRVYDVLSLLIDQGLVVKAAGKPALYRAVDPVDATATLLGAHRDSLARLELVAVDLVAALRQSWLEARAARRGAARTAPADARLSPARMEQWRDYARRSVLATARPPFDGLADPDWVRRVRSLTCSGGTVRCVYHADLLDDPRLVARAAAYAEAGEEARITESVETRMILTDSSRALVTVPFADPDASTGPVLLIDDAQAVEELEDGFDRLWARATPFAA